MSERTVDASADAGGRGDTGTSPVLDIRDVSASYGIGKHAVPVLQDVSLRVMPGRTMGVVGESGSGKSTLAKVVVGVLGVLGGDVEVAGTSVPGARGARQRELRRLVQMVPQDPYASLDPRMTVGRTLFEALAPRGGRESAHRERIAELLELVSLDPSVAARYPHEFSGGQRQRIAIARAIAVQPRLLVADEITSALDASIQFEVLELLDRLQRELGFGCVFITHNLGVAARVCDEITVMRFGRVLEQGPISLLADPADPYTRLLVSSVPDPEGLFLHQESSYGGDPAAGR